MLKQQINDDLKKAMLAGDKSLAELMGMLKSAILYKEVELGAREEGLSDDQVIEVLSKESKKRHEASDMYKSAGDEERFQKELKEKEIIDAYLPEKISEEDLVSEIEQVISEVQPQGMKDMGRVIGAVKAKLGNTADGALVAKFVKERLQ